MVCPQKGLLVVQLPVPALGVLSVVKIPPASTAKSAACACAKTDRSNEQKSVTSVLFKMTSQQNFDCWRDYKGDEARIPAPVPTLAPAVLVILFCSI